MNKFLVFRLTDEADYYKAIITAFDLQDARNQFELIMGEDNMDKQCYMITPLVDYRFVNRKVRLAPGTQVIMRMLI